MKCSFRLKKIFRLVPHRLGLFHSTESLKSDERAGNPDHGRRFSLDMKCVAAAAVVLLTCSTARAQQFGLFTSFQPREITPGLFVRFAGERVGYQWNMSLPIVLNDPYNLNRTNISYWSLFMGGIVGIEYLTGGEFDITVDSSGNTVPGILLLILPVLSNGQLSFNLLPKSSADQAGVQIAPFIGWDTALFAMRKIGWFRFSPQAGISCMRIFGTPQKGRKRFSLALKLGVREDFEFSPQSQKHMFAFLTLEAGLY